ncbi:cysteine hydrolase family protein [Alicyclobacillus tolerans]|nr:MULTISPECIES: isochorismatase family cysteine hydrolase [Alicyclobacillus]MDP9729519.1 nicotinamidase-related amidase [Alicyclobacillus tengchongensis]QRF22742.1 cysteine hydrolase [Alicyclobacillus sp. TC]
MSQTALLVMDMQNGIVSRFAEDPSVLEPFKHAVALARKSEVMVIFVRVAFRPGYPEISSRNLSFSRIAKNPNDMIQSEFSTQIHESVAPQPEEAVVTKLRVSAFTGSDLEVLLRAQHIERLVLCGIATSGVVLSTLREAADKDYELVVLADACLDADEEVHRVLIEKVFPRQAEVMTVAEWAKMLDGRLN